MNLVIVCEFIKSFPLQIYKWIKRSRKILLCQNFELYSIRTYVAYVAIPMLYSIPIPIYMLLYCGDIYVVTPGIIKSTLFVLIHFAYLCMCIC